MTATTTDCYVYYRVEPSREDAARAALAAVQSELEATTGVRGNAFSKTQEPLLWMEVYAGLTDADAVMEAVARLADKHGLSACLAEHERRHVEQFSPLAAGR